MKENIWCCHFKVNRYDKEIFLRLFELLAYDSVE